MQLDMLLWTDPFFPPPEYENYLPFAFSEVFLFFPIFHIILSETKAVLVNIGRAC